MSKPLPTINPYLFPTSSLAGSAVADQANENEDGLFNTREPQYAILHEKPEHRIVLNLKLKGLSNREIAWSTGYHPQHLTNILRQPWAREYIARELKKQGAESVGEIIQHAACASVHTLIELRDDENVLPAVRKAAASDLLDRYLGKPKQAIEHSGNIDLNKLSDDELIKLVNPRPVLELKDD